MDTLGKLMEITGKLDHLENTAEFIARETIHSDNVLSQSATLICTVADDLRERVFTLVRDLEELYDLESFH